MLTASQDLSRVSEIFAGLIAEWGEPERARDKFAFAHAVNPQNLHAALGAHLTLPVIYADTDAIESARTGFRQGLDKLNREFDVLVGALSEAQVLDGLRWSNFNLGYQWQDDRALQSEYANFVARAIDAVAPQWRIPMAPRRRLGARVRVGFASSFLNASTVGRLSRILLTDLDPARFEVFVYDFFHGDDEVSAAIQNRADHFRTYGTHRADYSPMKGRQWFPSVVAPQIRADDLDVLIYPELGMDGGLLALAALRLAPLQCTTWCHPVTTGHSTIDVFFSVAAMEPEGCEAHYTEKLIQLPGIGSRFPRPTFPRDADRRQFGLPSDATLLLCPQSLFKIHPDNDYLFARILADCPGTLLVLLPWIHPTVTDQYMHRLARAFERYGLSISERTRVLPRLSHDDYLRLNLVCDAMIDTLHWSGGHTSLEALACGLPIVTLPGALMRGRHTMAMLSLLGVPELIARDEDDYGNIAIRLLLLPGWRDLLRGRILGAHAKLFDDPAPVIAFAEALAKATEQHDMRPESDKVLSMECAR